MLLKKVFKTYLLILVAVFIQNTMVTAQLDTIHFFSPLHVHHSGGTWDKAHLYLSTPSITPIEVRVYRGTSATPTYTVNISNAAPVDIDIMGVGTSDVTATALQTVMTNRGFRLEGDGDFYADCRLANDPQSEIITSKGKCQYWYRFQAHYDTIPTKR